MTFEQIAGAALTLLFLADIFLSVLYARAGTGLSLRLGHAIAASRDAVQHHYHAPGAAKQSRAPITFRTNAHSRESSRIHSKPARPYPTLPLVQVG